MPKLEDDQDELDIELTGKWDQFQELFAQPMAALVKHLDVPVKIKLINVMTRLSNYVYGENILSYLQDDTLAENAEKFVSTDKNDDDDDDDDDDDGDKELDDTIPMDEGD